MKRKFGLFYIKNKLGPLDKVMFELGLVGLGIIAASALVYFITGFSVLSLRFGCVFNKVTGLLCPGCGGTRATRALLRGQFLRSIYDHPAVMFGVIVYVVFMVRCGLFALFGIRKSKDGAIVKYIFIFIGIVLVQWVIKLIAQLCFGYHWFYG